MKLTKPSIDAPMVDWALWWAGRGWLVFPVWQPIDGDLCGCGKLHTNNDSGKHPISKCAPSGFKDGTTDAEVIRSWWGQYPSANIASTLPAGQIAIDIDGPLDEGVEFPPTWTHTTGKGEHRIYDNNIEHPLSQSQGEGRIWTNVDTRVSGVGYIVLPPSMHKSGTRYLIGSESPVIEFPTSMAINATKPKRKTASKPSGDTDIIKLLTIDRGDASLGDDAMAKVAGYYARFIPDKDTWFATISAINMSLASPLDELAMNKKKNIFDKHHDSIKESIAKAEDDAARGWLYEMGETGYSTPIDTKGSVEYVPFSDFRVSCKGIIIADDAVTYVVDFFRDGELIREGEKLHASTLSSTAQLRTWLMNRGMNLHANNADKRSHPGTRLAALMRSQNPPVMISRDYYGWCDEVSAFIIDEGQVTAEGLQPFSNVYPMDALKTGSPVRYLWEADLNQARDWLSRVLDLQPARESAKIGAWAMMLLLRGQWEGILPGLSIDAFAGTGKTTYFKLFGKLIGSTNEGESQTLPSARDQLSGNNSGFIWLDDVEIDARMQALLRQAVTQQKMKKMAVDGASGAWTTEEKPLRGSVVISGEGSELARQKAVRDRFITVNFEVNPTADAEKLKREHIERASGVILQEVLKCAPMLAELESLREGVTSRDKQGQTTLRIGARILDAVLGTGSKWTEEIDAWFNGEAVADDQGNASENILHVFPRIWLGNSEPKTPGIGEIINPIWFNESDRCFYINTARCDAAWKAHRDARMQVLTSQSGMVKELKACKAEGVKVRTRTDNQGENKLVSYLKLPMNYSKMILDALDHVEED